MPQIQCGSLTRLSVFSLVEAWILIPYDHNCFCKFLTNHWSLIWIERFQPSGTVDSCSVVICRTRSILHLREFVCWIDRSSDRFMLTCKFVATIDGSQIHRLVRRGARVFDRSVRDLRHGGDGGEDGASVAKQVAAGCRSYWSASEIVESLRHGVHGCGKRDQTDRVALETQPGGAHFHRKLATNRLTSNRMFRIREKCNLDFDRGRESERVSWFLSFFAFVAGYGRSPPNIFCNDTVICNFRRDFYVFELWSDNWLCKSCTRRVHENVFFSRAKLSWWFQGRRSMHGSGDVELKLFTTLTCSFLLGWPSS